MNTIHETAEDTARKIQIVLKREFPDVTFTLSSTTNMVSSSVNIHWIDGALATDVQNEIAWMCSSQYDLQLQQGYEWEGKRYMGAGYIFYWRELSPNRKRYISSQMNRYTDPSDQGDFSRLQWEEVERRLIAQGELVGHFASSRNESHEGIADVLHSDQINNVIPFRIKQNKQLTAEQSLKYEMMQMIFEDLELPNKEQILVKKGNDIDDLFSYVASLLYRH